MVLIMSNKKFGVWSDCYKLEAWKSDYQNQKFGVYFSQLKIWSEVLLEVDC